MNMCKMSRERNIVISVLFVTILCIQTDAVNSYSSQESDRPNPYSLNTNISYKTAEIQRLSVYRNKGRHGVSKRKDMDIINVVYNKTLKCGMWGKNEPTDKNDPCSMRISDSTAEHFMDAIHANDYNFMHLKLVFHSKSVSHVQYSKCVIQPQDWVWTFKGKGGALQYLYWPMDYSIWSLGLLDSKTRIDDFIIDIHVHGNCPVAIDEKNTTSRIGLALTDMVTRYLGYVGEKYNYSYFCYKSRIFIDGENLYGLCLHTICPVEAIGYRCCHMKWDFQSENWITTCPGKYYYYDAMWWIYPFAIGLLLYIFFPVLLMWIASNISHWKRSIAPTPGTNEEEMSLLQNHLENDWIGENPVTIRKTVLKPFRYFCSVYPNLTTKLIMIFAAIFSMSVVGLKILLYQIYNRDFVVSAVEQGSPMDFLTVLAGYDLSKKYFLRDFGGPFVACGVYIVFLVLVLCVPSDLSTFLSKGLPDSSSKSVSPLCIDRTNKERLGSMFFRHKRGGFTLIYNTMVIHFFLLLSPSFWSHAISKQFQRYGMITRLLAGNDVILLFIVKTLFTPFYFLFCIVEAILCVLYYGVPVVFFSLTAFRAYCCPVWRKVRTSRSYLKLFATLFILVEICVLLFVLYIFSIVFVDSFLFLARIAIFTYTGLFAYPGFSYGYIIFSLTVLMYFWESVMKIDKVYGKLFKQSILLCEEYQTNNEFSTAVFKKKDSDVKFIPRKLFYEMFKRHEPIRVNMFKIVFKITVIIIVLFISVKLLINFEKFGELSILTQALATLFVCMIPKLANSFCFYNEEDITQEEKDDQLETIRNFIKSEMSAK